MTIVLVSLCCCTSLGLGFCCSVVARILAAALRCHTASKSAYLFELRLYMANAVTNPSATMSRRAFSRSQLLVVNILVQVTTVDRAADVW